MLERLNHLYYFLDFLHAPSRACLRMLDAQIIQENKRKWGKKLLVNSKVESKYYKLLYSNIQLCSQCKITVLGSLKNQELQEHLFHTRFLNYCLNFIWCKWPHTLWDSHPSDKTHILLSAIIIISIPSYWTLLVINMS